MIRHALKIIGGRWKPSDGHQEYQIHPPTIDTLVTGMVVAGVDVGVVAGVVDAIDLGVDEGVVDVTEAKGVAGCVVTVGGCWWRW